MYGRFIILAWCLLICNAFGNGYVLVVNQAPTSESREGSSTNLILLYIDTDTKSVERAAVITNCHIDWMQSAYPFGFLYGSETGNRPEIIRWVTIQKEIKVRQYNNNDLSVMGIWLDYTQPMPTAAFLWVMHIPVKDNIPWNDVPDSILKLDLSTGIFSTQTETSVENTVLTPCQGDQSRKDPDISFNPISNTFTCKMACHETTWKSLRPLPTAVLASNKNSNWFFMGDWRGNYMVGTLGGPHDSFKDRSVIYKRTTDHWMVIDSDTATCSYFLNSSFVIFQLSGKGEDDYGNSRNNGKCRIVSMEKDRETQLALTSNSSVLSIDTNKILVREDDRLELITFDLDTGKVLEKKLLCQRPAMRFVKLAFHVDKKPEFDGNIIQLPKRADEQKKADRSPAPSAKSK